MVPTNNSGTYVVHNGTTFWRVHPWTDIRDVIYKSENTPVRILEPVHNLTEQYERKRVDFGIMNK